MSLRHALVLPLLLLALVSSPGGAAVATDPAGNPDFVDLPAACSDEQGYPTPAPCHLRAHEKGAPLLVLWGDSHAWQMIPALRAAVGRAADGQDVDLVSFVMGGCPPLYPALRTAQERDDANGCDLYGHRVVDFVSRAVARGRDVRVVVAMAWELYHDVTDPPNRADRLYPGTVNDWIATNARKSLAATPRAFRALDRLGVTTDVVGQLPMVPSVERPCAQRGYECSLPREGTLKDAGENVRRAREMRRLAGARGHLVRPAQRLCTAEVCRGRIDGVPTYYDRLHVGQRTSLALARFFEPVVRDFVAHLTDRAPEQTTS